jgi:hypothetical protein
LKFLNKDFEMKDNIIYDEYYLFIKPTANQILLLKNINFTVKEESFISKTFLGDDNHTKFKIILKIIQNFKKGCIITHKYVFILVLLKKMLEKNLKNFKVILFDSKLTTNNRSDLTKTINPYTDIILLSSNLGCGLNLNMYDVLINLETDK